jgi:aspartate/methionine/tyrosine aminotransferase
MTICDAGDEVIIFKPYYFNHLMALQLINAKVPARAVLVSLSWLTCDAGRVRSLSRG